MLRAQSKTQNTESTNSHSTLNTSDTSDSLLNNIHKKVTNMILQQVDLQFTRVADTLNNINQNNQQSTPNFKTNNIKMQTEEPIITINDGEGAERVKRGPVMINKKNINPPIQICPQTLNTLGEQEPFSNSYTNQPLHLQRPNTNTPQHTKDSSILAESNNNPHTVVQSVNNDSLKNYAGQPLYVQQPNINVHSGPKAAVPDNPVIRQPYHVQTPYRPRDTINHKNVTNIDNTRTPILKTTVSEEFKRIYPVPDTYFPPYYREATKPYK